MTTTCEIPCDIELSPLSAAEPLGPHVLVAALPFLEAVKVTVDVRVGRVASTVGDLLALRDGQVLTLDRSLDEPLDVLIDGQVVARGTLVAVGEHFGLRLTQAPALSGANAREGGAAAADGLDPMPIDLRGGAAAGLAEVTGREDATWQGGANVPAILLADRA